MTDALPAPVPFCWQRANNGVVHATPLDDATRVLATCRHAPSRHYDGSGDFWDASVLTPPGGTASKTRFASEADAQAWIASELEQRGWRLSGRWLVESDLRKQLEAARARIAELEARVAQTNELAEATVYAAAWSATFSEPNGDLHPGTEAAQAVEDYRAWRKGENEP